MAKLSFWQVAKRPKWIGGLFVALLIAVVFSLLMQWQLSRTFNVVGVVIEENDPVPLNDLVQPGTLQPFIFDRQAFVTTDVDEDQIYIVQDRLQLVGEDRVSGYWLVANSVTQVDNEPVSLTLALGFAADLEAALAAKARLSAGPLEVSGYIQPSEAPVDSGDSRTLGALSLAQLVNFYSNDPFASYPIYLIVQDGIDVGLEQISIGIRQQGIEINWLTLFYALEWAFFALAAFYLWGRMVMDERNRELEISDDALKQGSA